MNDVGKMRAILNKIVLRLDGVQFIECLKLSQLPNKSSLARPLTVFMRAVRVINGPTNSRIIVEPMAKFGP